MRDGRRVPLTTSASRPTRSTIDRRTPTDRPNDPTIDRSATRSAILLHLLPRRRLHTHTHTRETGAVARISTISCALQADPSAAHCSRRCAAPAIALSPFFLSLRRGQRGAGRRLFFGAPRVIGDMLWRGSGSSTSSRMMSATTPCTSFILDPALVPLIGRPTRPLVCVLFVLEGPSTGRSGCVGDGVGRRRPAHGMRRELCGAPCAVSYR